MLILNITWTAEGVTAWAWDPTTQYPLASIWRFVITIFFVSLIAFYLLRPFKVQYHNMFSYSVSIPSQHDHFLWMFLYGKFSCMGDLCFYAMIIYLFYMNCSECSFQKKKKLVLDKVCGLLLWSMLPLPTLL